MAVRVRVCEWMSLYLCDVRVGVCCFLLLTPAQERSAPSAQEQMPVQPQAAHVHLRRAATHSESSPSV